MTKDVHFPATEGFVYLLSLAGVLEMKKFVDLVCRTAEYRTTPYTVEPLNGETVEDILARLNKGDLEITDKWILTVSPDEGPYAVAKILLADHSNAGWDGEMEWYYEDEFTEEDQERLEKEYYGEEAVAN